MLRSLLSLLMSSRIWAWMVTSSAVVGSSQMRTSGFAVKAIAMTILCLIPPENSKGYCLKRTSGWGIPTSLITFKAASLASCLVMVNLDLYSLLSSFSSSWMCLISSWFWASLAEISFWSSSLLEARYFAFSSSLNFLISASAILIFSSNAFFKAGRFFL